jgi:O-antigen ligase
VLSGGASRLTTLQSNRYDYWDVALRAFSSEPVHGVGAGGWSVWWLRYRTINDFAQDAHSLPLQTLAELGVVGIVLLAAFFAGIGVAAAEAHGVAPAAAAGPIAGFIAYAAHVPLDWDWQMPAVTIVALILAGELIALAQLSRRARAPAPTGGPGGP